MWVSGQGKLVITFTCCQSDPGSINLVAAQVRPMSNFANLSPTWHWSLDSCLTTFICYLLILTFIFLYLHSLKKFSRFCNRCMVNAGIDQYNCYNFDKSLNIRIRCCSCVLQIRLGKANKRKFAFCLDVFASVSCAGASVTRPGPVGGLMSLVWCSRAQNRKQVFIRWRSELLTE